MKIDVKIHALRTEGSRLADASVCLDDCFAVKGVRIVNGSNGPFVSMPSYKGRDGYKDVCFPCTKEFRQEFDCQRQFEIVRKRRRNFVVFRRQGGATKSSVSLVK